MDYRDESVLTAWQRRTDAVLVQAAASLPLVEARRTARREAGEAGLWLASGLQLLDMCVPLGAPAYPMGIALVILVTAGIWGARSRSGRASARRTFESELRQARADHRELLVVEQQLQRVERSEWGSVAWPLFFVVALSVMPWRLLVYLLSGLPTTDESPGAGVLAGIPAQLALAWIVARDVRTWTARPTRPIVPAQSNALSWLLVIAAGLVTTGVGRLLGASVVDAQTMAGALALGFFSAAASWLVWWPGPQWLVTRAMLRDRQDLEPLRAALQSSAGEDPAGKSARIDAPEQPLAGEQEDAGERDEQEGAARRPSSHLITP